MKNDKLPTRLVSLCWTVVGRWEQIGKENQQEVSRIYSKTMMLAHLVTGGLAKPTEAARARLEDLAHYLACEYTSRGIYTESERVA